MFLAAAAWGCTNPFLKRGASRVGAKKTNIQSHDGRIRQFLSYMVFLFTQWQVFLPLAINQLGSIFNLYALGPGGAELSVAIPVITSLQFVFTAATGWILGEEDQQSIRTFVGILLTVIGVCLCLSSQII